MKQTIKVKRTRKQAAPTNVAAKALSEGQFRLKVVKNPKAYTRKGKRGAVPPVAELAEEPKDDD